MLLTIKDAAEFLRYEPKTVRRFIREGRLEAIKFGRSYRLKKSALERFVNDNETNKNGQLGCISGSE